MTDYKTSDAQRSAIKKYQDKLDAVTVRFPSGFKSVITEHISYTGESLVKFLQRAVEETIRRDRERMRQSFKPAPKSAETEEE